MTTALIVLACIAFWAIIALGVHLKLFRGFVKSNQARSLFDFDVWRIDSGV